MDPALHKAAMQGSVASLRTLVAGNLKILNSTTPQGNNALHIAAMLGHAHFAGELLAMNEELLVARNSDGDTPLHLAARAGKAGVADLLVGLALSWPEDLAAGTGDGAADDSPYLRSPLIMANATGNTPLHEAVRHGRSAVAIALLEAEPGRCHALNERMESPLHIAAREGLADVVAKIVKLPWVDEKFVPSVSVSGTALHQAVLGGHTKIVEILLEKRPELTELTDAGENNALHYAAQKNQARMVDMLLNKRPVLAYKRNRPPELQSPLHVAAHYGSAEAIRALLRQCPDVSEMVDGAGRNAFHVAVAGGKVEALRCLLRHVRPEEVLNRVDHDGNTALHLAAKMTRIQSALLLLKDPRVNPCVLNHDGQTARSLIEKARAGAGAGGDMDTYEMYLWKQLKRQESIKCKKQPLPPVATYQSLRGRRASSHEYFELSVETYTLVATLIATVTFAATFTMPGGYWADARPGGAGDMIGTAVHGHTAAFKIFVISNTVAMCSSIVVVFCFIWAWRDPVKFKLDQLMWGHRLTVLACLAMVVSLMTAVYVTVAPNSRWPAYVVIAIGASTPVVVVLILGKEVLFVPL